MSPSHHVHVVARAAATLTLLLAASAQATTVLPAITHGDIAVLLKPWPPGWPLRTTRSARRVT